MCASRSADRDCVRTQIRLQPLASSIKIAPWRVLYRLRATLELQLLLLRGFRQLLRMCYFHSLAVFNLFSFCFSSAAAYQYGFSLIFKPKIPAFCHKSTQFGTQVDIYITNRFGHGPISDQTFGGHGDHFSKWPP